MQQTAVIIGAGPAGLTAALELLERTDIRPIILEASGDIGGISKTVNYKGNRIDIGGHRFFSKSDRVMDWWLKILPLENTGNTSIRISYQNSERSLQVDQAPPRYQAPSRYPVTGETESNLPPQPGKPEGAPAKEMLLRKRVSRIYFLKRFFDYPIRLSLDTIRKLGPVRITKILFSYLRTKLSKPRTEKSLEDFFINRFGRNLYETFFRDYTHKVWGVPCNRIPAEWGKQRIKELSIRQALVHAVKARTGKAAIGQKNVPTTLIEQFLYPRLGPGQLWQEVAERVINLGGEIHFHSPVSNIEVRDNQVISVSTTGPAVTNPGKGFPPSDPGTNPSSGNPGTRPSPIDPGKAPLWSPGLTGFSTSDPANAPALNPADTEATINNPDTGSFTNTFHADYFFSTMPVPALIAGIQGTVIPADVKEIAANLQYRDFITVGILLKKLTTRHGSINDNWIYIQEKDVMVGRIQVFNNWSPSMVENPNNTWIGMEYFCNTTDPFWQQADSEIAEFAIRELVKMDLASEEDVLDHTVIRMEKTYPAYFGSYERFSRIREYTDQFTNLFLVGRNGMHKYNNADHSMLTAMIAVDNILAGRTDKSNIWQVNTEQDYHEN